MQVSSPKRRILGAIHPGKYSRTACSDPGRALPDRRHDLLLQHEPTRLRAVEDGLVDHVVLYSLVAAWAPTSSPIDLLRPAGNRIELGSEKDTLLHPETNEFQSWDHKNQTLKCHCGLPRRRTARPLRAVHTDLAVWLENDGRRNDLAIGKRAAPACLSSVVKYRIGHFREGAGSRDERGGHPIGAEAWPSRACSIMRACPSSPRSAATAIIVIKTARLGLQFSGNAGAFWTLRYNSAKGDAECRCQRFERTIGFRWVITRQHGRRLSRALAAPPAVSAPVYWKASLIGAIVRAPVELRGY